MISASGRIGSTATMEDSVVSSQFGSQSGSESGLLGSRDSLDDLDSRSSRTGDKHGRDDNDNEEPEDEEEEEEEDDDSYQGFVPEPTREVDLSFHSNIFFNF